MQTVPLADVAAQVLSVTLGGQPCRIALYLKATGLYCDVSVSDAVIVSGVLCLDRNRIVRDAYLGFAGDLLFVDMQARMDPTSPGLGSRYLLVYLETTDS